MAITPLFPNHPQNDEMEAMLAAEREAAKKTATHSSNWWDSLSPARRRVLLKIATSREVHRLCLEKNRAAIGHETDEKPFSTRHRIEVRMLHAFEFEGAVTSCADAAVDWHYPIGQLFRLRERGASAPSVGLIVLYGRDGQPDEIFVPMGIRLRDERCVAPLRLVVSPQSTFENGKIHFHAGGDELYIDNISNGRGWHAHLTPGSSKLLTLMLEAVLPGEWAPSPTDDTSQKLAAAIAG